AASGGPAFRYVEGQRMVPEDARQADPEEFPLPFMLGGPKPTLPGGAAAQASGRGRASTTGDAARPGSSRTIRPGPGDPAAGVSDAESPQTPAAKPLGSCTSAASPTTKKPVTIDPKILEKPLQGNANRRPVGD